VSRYYVTEEDETGRVVRTFEVVLHDDGDQQWYVEES
jgi:hypothetical protein